MIASSLIDSYYGDRGLHRLSQESSWIEDAAADDDAPIWADASGIAVMRMERRVLDAMHDVAMADASLRDAQGPHAAADVRFDCLRVAVRKVPGMSPPIERNLASRGWPSDSSPARSGPGELVQHRGQFLRVMLPAGDGARRQRGIGRGSPGRL